MKNRSGEQTRQTILTTAVSRFARGPYENVTLRDIAADVKIDVALVHRHFGSKEQLFREAIKEAVRPHNLVTGKNDDVLKILSERLLNKTQDHSLPDALNIFVQSLSSLKARQVLQDFVTNDYIPSISNSLPQANEFKVTMLIACLTGISIMKDVIEVDCLKQDADNQINEVLPAILRACLEV